MADAFADEIRTVRLSPIRTDGAVESLALLGAGKADLAVGRGDLETPAEAHTVAGHRVGVIGRTPANAALLRVILSASGVAAGKGRG